MGVERLQQQLNTKVEKDTQVVGALADQCGTLSCLMSKKRMEFSTWRKDFAMRYENGEKSFIASSAEMRELKQASAFASLDNIEDSGNNRCIENENLGSSFLDLNTAAGSPSPSGDYSRSTCSQRARGRICSASASIHATAPSFCGKTSESGSEEVHMTRQMRTSASLHVLPSYSMDHWGDGACSANLVAEGGRERTHGGNGTAPGTNEKGGRGLVNTSPTQTSSRRGPLASSSFSPARFPSKHNKLSPASPECRGVRQSSRLKEW